MESLLMQLAMAAMSQFGGGRSVPMSGGMPIPMPSRPMAPYSSPAPVSNGWQPSMQASTLASTTCLLRSGRTSRDQGLGSVGADLSGGSHHRFGRRLPGLAERQRPWKRMAGSPHPGGRRPSRSKSAGRFRSLSLPLTRFHGFDRLPLEWLAVLALIRLPSRMSGLSEVFRTQREGFRGSA